MGLQSRRFLLSGSCYRRRQLCGEAGIVGIRGQRFDTWPGLCQGLCSMRRHLQRWTFLKVPAEALMPFPSQLSCRVRQKPVQHVKLLATLRRQRRRRLLLLLLRPFLEPLMMGHICIITPFGCRSLGLLGVRGTLWEVGRLEFRVHASCRTLVNLRTPL